MEISTQEHIEETGLAVSPTGTSAAIEEWQSYERPSYFDACVGVWIPAVICSLGIIGNVIALIILSQDKKSILFYTLKILAISDTVLLICAILQQVIPMYCIDSHSRSSICRHQGYMRVYSWPVLCIAQMVSVWLVVLIAGERYVAVVRPLKSRSHCTISRVRAITFLILLLSLAFNVPKFLEFRPKQEIDPALNQTVTKMGVTWLRRNEVYRFLYNTALNGILFYALPLSMLTFLTAKTFICMRRAERKWEALNARQRNAIKTSKMPLVIILVFFICGTQAFLAFIFDAIFISGSYWLQIYTAIVNVLVMLNAAVNVMVMYIFNMRFRFLFRHTCDRLCDTQARQERVAMERSEFASSFWRRRRSSPYRLERAPAIRL